MMKKMMKTKIKKISVHAYKYNKIPYRSWEFPIIVEENNEYIKCNVKKTFVISANKKNSNKFVYSQIKKETCWYFFKNKMYNLLITNLNTKIKMYFNIASPFCFKNNIISYIDFDLDICVFIDSKNNVKISKLDIDEFENHKNKFNYPENLINCINSTFIELEKAIISGKFNKFINYERKN